MCLIGIFIMDEIWKKIHGFDNYLISNTGNVKSLGFDYIGENNTRCVIYPRILKLNFNKKNGYQYIILRKDKKPKTLPIHRIVAMSFIPNIENKRCVNHKNGVKTDNNVENLEWVTNSENTRHSIFVLKNKSNYKIGSKMATNK